MSASSESGSTSPVLVGHLHTNARFSSVAWTPYSENGRYPMGLVIGGMVDGTLNVWSLHGDGSDGLTPQLEQTLAPGGGVSWSGSITALSFSPLESHHVAAGTTNGHVLVLDCQAMSVDHPADQAASPSKDCSITSTAWNSQVAHILASSGSDGHVQVWDTKSRKVWCEIRATDNMGVLTDILCSKLAME